MKRRPRRETLDSATLHTSHSEWLETKRVSARNTFAKSLHHKAIVDGCARRALEARARRACEGQGVIGVASRCRALRSILCSFLCRGKARRQRMRRLWLLHAPCVYYFIKCTFKTGPRLAASMPHVKQRVPSSEQKAQRRRLCSNAPLRQGAADRFREYHHRANVGSRQAAL